MLIGPRAGQVPAPAMFVDVKPNNEHTIPTQSIYCTALLRTEIINHSCCHNFTRESKRTS